MGKERRISVYDPVRYKQDSIDNWNRRAHDYHSGWAGSGRGPFRSTAELARAARIRESDMVLDVACGTGAVSAEAARYLGPSGMLIGFDFARGTLEIAKANVPSGNFIEMDAENIGLYTKFDKVLCQYALMFFPEPGAVLEQLRSLTKQGGMLAVAVHGSSQGVPYFSTIMEQVLRHIPDIRPEGTPTVHRFGNPEDLGHAIASAGFKDIKVTKFTFSYEAGTFDEYWADYMSTTAASIRPRIEAKGAEVVASIKKEAANTAGQFTKNGAINFPWDVLVATARG
jgi:ubiquinone/menaquinone biosynthesis C-methylase UbiE